MTVARQRLRALAISHDELPAFRAAYIVGILLCAALLNIGAFVLLVVAHMALDTVKYRDVERQSWLTTCRLVFRESILDLALLVLALVFAVYLHPGAGIMAAKTAFRTEAFLLLSAGTLLPKVQIMTRILGVFGNVDAHLQRRRKSGWTAGEYACGWLLLLGLSLLALAPAILPVDTAKVGALLLEQLIPGAL